jgi:hypothetical protein
MVAIAPGAAAAQRMKSRRDTDSFHAMASAPQDFNIILCKGFQQEIEIFNGEKSAHPTPLLENLSVSSQNPDCGIPLYGFQWWVLQVLCQKTPPVQKELMQLRRRIRGELNDADNRGCKHDKRNPGVREGD